MQTTDSFKTNLSACILVIGNELLSGQIRDENLHYLSKQLHEMGIHLQEARFIQDVTTDIVEAVREAHRRYDYVFTTGGIGPTHDDITAASIAQAFRVPLVCSVEAYQKMTRKYPDSKASEALARMSLVPQGAHLIHNTVSAAPGFQVKNVFVLAGVPEIMRAMFEECSKKLQKGTVPFCREVIVNIVEGLLAKDLETLQKHYQSTEIGSYPFKPAPTSHAVRVVIKGFVEEDVLAVADRVIALSQQHENKTQVAR
tara:strand:- start:439 stop:1206 length:768 start_codon:yes stop_codon:yes gene_type:complete